MSALPPGRIEALAPWLALGAGGLLVAALVLSALLGAEPAGGGGPAAPAPAATRASSPPPVIYYPEAARRAPAPDPTEATEPAVPAPDPTGTGGAAGAQVMAGLSTWIDLYDIQRTPEEQVAAASAAGVEVLFAQAARYNSSADIHDAARLGALLEAAHDRGLQVVTWYIPDFTDPDRALRRALAAARFTSPRGDRPDGFGLDIELDTVPDVGLRTTRLLELTAALHRELGGDLPLAAIVLPPLQLELNTTWWPDYPYAQLRAHFDVFVPMSYSSFRGTDVATTYEWNLANVRQLRDLTGDPALPVHLAGGLAGDLPEVAAFVDAARDGGVIGAGLYDLETTPAAAWAALRALRAEQLGDAP